MRNPISIEAFAEFCERKPAGEVYEYVDNRNCAFGQYLQFLGFESPNVGPWSWQANGVADRPLPSRRKMRDALNGCGEPRTFDALARRLRAAMAEG